MKECLRWQILSLTHSCPFARTGNMVVERSHRFPEKNGAIPLDKANVKLLFHVYTVLLKNGIHERSLAALKPTCEESIDKTT